MAFEYLRQAFAREFGQQKDFLRGTEERESKLATEDLTRQNIMQEMANRQRKIKATQKANDILLQVDATPISKFQKDLSKDQLNYLQRVEALGDPEALRTAENRVKFDVLTQKNPTVMEDIAIAFPELGTQISGITERSKLGEKKEVIGKEFQERGILSAQEHQQILEQIRAKGKQARRTLSLRIGKGMTLEEKDPRVKVAVRVIETLQDEASRAQDPNESDDAFAKRVRDSRDRINELSKFIDDVKRGKDVELPEVPQEEQDLLGDEVLQIFEEEQ